MTVACEKGWNNLGFDGADPNNRNSMSAVLQTAEKLERLLPCYDRHYYGHVAEGAERNVLPLPQSLPSDLVVLCKRLLAVEIIEKMMPAEDFCDEHLKASFRSVRIQYNQRLLQ